MHYQCCSYTNYSYRPAAFGRGHFYNASSVRSNLRYRYPEDKSKPGGQDRKRINANEDYELRDWAKKFGVSEAELKAAVKAVGDNATRLRNT